MNHPHFAATVITLCLAACLAQAQNPIIRDQFTADPTAKVFEGKLYLYPSHDIPSASARQMDWYCMADYHAFSSVNLTDWEDHGVILSQEQVPWAQQDSYTMWAPDCVYKDGKYYLYFSAWPQGGEQMFAIGVAVADRPEGPFTSLGTPIEGVQGIDPCVFIDKDGQSYLYWAGESMHMAKLQADMTTLATEPQEVEGLPDGFKEGPFLFERAGKYYFTFPWARENAETLAYCMADNPMGPFEFKGLIMDESTTGCRTNHHSIVEYQGQWYLFYHHNDYSPTFDKLRSVCVDSLSFNEDGTIQQVIPTRRGVGITDARTRIQIDRYSSVSPQGITLAYVDENDPFQGWQAVFTRKNAPLRYNRVDFGTTPVEELTVRARSTSGGTLQVSAGGNDELKVTVTIPKEDQWQEVRVPLASAPTGMHDLQVSLLDGTEVAVDWISFEGECNRCAAIGSTEDGLAKNPIIYASAPAGRHIGLRAEGS